MIGKSNIGGHIILGNMYGKSMITIHLKVDCMKIQIGLVLK